MGRAELVWSLWPPAPQQPVAESVLHGGRPRFVRGVLQRDLSRVAGRRGGGTRLARWISASGTWSVPVAVVTVT